MVSLGPYICAVVLLMAGGIAKVARPKSTSIALRQAGLPFAPTVVRIAAAVEVAIGVAAWISGSPVPGFLVAASYLAFAGFVVIALVGKLPVASCGCFGEADSIPTAAHVVVNIGLSLAAVSYAIAATAGQGAAAHLSLAYVVTHQTWLGIPLLLLSGAASYCAYLVLTALPALRNAGAGAR